MLRYLKRLTFAETHLQSDRGHLRMRLTFDDKFFPFRFCLRDLVPSALAFLMNGEPKIVKKLILEDTTSSWVGKRVDLFKLVEDVMQACFEVLHDDTRKIDTLIEDFGERDNLPLFVSVQCNSYY